MTAVASRKAWKWKLVALTALTLAAARADAQDEAQSAAPAAAPAPVPAFLTDTLRLKQAIDAAQSGDVFAARAAAATLTDPVARKLILWTSIDAAGSSLNFSDLDAARRDLAGWPRAARRQAAAEKALEYSGRSPQQVADWFAGSEPETAEGAMALAQAWRDLGRAPDADALVLRFWRERVFEADAQARMIARFGALLTPDDYARRLDMLLYGPQGPATRALMDLVAPDVRAVAEARIALRSNRDDAPAVVAQVPAELQSSPGLAFERARYYRKRNLDVLAAGLLKDMGPPPAGYPGAVSLVWNERRALMMSLLRSGDMQAAYEAAAHHGLPPGEEYTEAEFFAGWIALSKLNNAAEAAAHFANVHTVGESPITVSRALYWRGRAADAQGEAEAAKAYWTEGAKFYTAFYGQLSADKIGQTSMALPADPAITPADRATFESRELVRAARLLLAAGERDLFRTFVLNLDDVVPSTVELALLHDLAKSAGDQDLAMRVARAGAQRGLILPERGYPLRTGSPLPPVAAEPALVHAIIRQESNFDPVVRSGVGARGMMQLMPATASGVARKLGLPYSADRLNDPDYNIVLGSAYLGGLVSNFSGSYVMAAAGYNAGPGRSVQWAAECGDPRGGATDPADFIECIPFSETRNYVMRIMESTQVYRARLAGGEAPLSAMADLKRGGWVASQPYQIASIGPAPAPPSAPPLADEAAPVATPVADSYTQWVQGLAATANRLAEDDRVDVSSGRHDKGGKAVKAKRSAKKGGKAKASAGLKHKSKVAKAKSHGGKGKSVARRKARG